MQFELGFIISEVEGVAVVESNRTVGQIFQIALVVQSRIEHSKEEGRVRATIEGARSRVKGVDAPLALIEWPVNFSPGSNISVDWILGRLSFTVSQTPGSEVDYFAVLAKAATISVLVEFNSDLPSCYHLGVQPSGNRALVSNENPLSPALFRSRSNAKPPHPRSLQPIAISMAHNTNPGDPAVLDLSRAQLPGNRLCVFCYQVPEKPTREHLVPRWIRVDIAEQFGHCDGLIVTACDLCNREAGKLEEQIQLISSGHRHNAPMPPEMHSKVSDYMTSKAATIGRILGFDLETRDPFQFTQLLGTDLCVPTYLWFYRINETTGKTEWGCALSMGWWLAVFATDRSSGQSLLNATLENLRSVATQRCSQPS